MSEGDSSRTGEVAARVGDFLHEPHVLEGLLYQIRRLLRNLRALFVLTSLLFVWLVISSKRLYQAIDVHYATLRHNVEAMLDARYEARRDDEYLGVVAAVLGEINQSPGSFCQPGQPSCDEAELFLRLASTMGTDVASNGATPAVLDRAISDVEGSVSGRRSDFSLLAWSAEAHSKFNQAAKGEAPVLLEPCDPLADHSLVAHDTDYGPALCTQEANPRFFLNSLASRDDSKKDNVKKDETKKLDIGERLKKSMALAFVLDLAVHVVARPDCRLSDDHQPGFLQAYFISPDSLLRLWTCLPVTEKVPLAFPNTKNWAAVHYFEQIMSGEDTYVSPAYIDYNGGGIVRTKCRAILGPVHDDSGHNPWHRILSGAVCADLLLPKEAIVEHLRNNQLVDAYLVHATHDIGNHFESRLVRIERLRTEVEQGHSHTPDEIVQMMNGYLDGNGAFGRHTLTEMLRGIAPMQTGATRGFFVPLGGTSDSGEFNGLMIIPNIPRIQFGRPFGEFVVALVVFLAMAVTTYTARRRLEEAQVLTGMMTGLEVGILVVGPDEHVAGGNAVAERVLDTLLPRITPKVLLSGVADDLDDTQSQRFDELIEDSIIEITDLERSGLGDDAVSYKQTIPAKRRDNRSSSYYARLRKTGRWIAVTAAAIDGRIWRDRPWTYGIVRFTTEETSKKCEATYRRAQGKR